MRIVSFGPKREEKPGVVHRNRVIDLLAADSAIPPTVRGILEANELDRIEAILARAEDLPDDCFAPLGEVRLGLRSPGRTRVQYTNEQRQGEE